MTADGRPDYSTLPEPINLADTVEELDPTPTTEGPLTPFDEEFRVIILGAAG